MTGPRQDYDPEARVEADELEQWARRLNVTPEELRSAVQKGGAAVKDVIAELRRRNEER